MSLGAFGAESSKSADEVGLNPFLLVIQAAI
jgi:hypothetical protein